MVTGKGFPIEGRFVFCCSCWLVCLEGEIGQLMMVLSSGPQKSVGKIRQVCQIFLRKSKMR